MTWSIIALACLTVGQVNGPKPLSGEELAALVAQLGSSSFVERESATQKLWASAAQTQDELAKLLNTSQDPEVRYRLAIILERFRRGIYADTPAASIRYIEMFNRDRRLRSEALRELRDAGDWVTIVRLLANASELRAQELLDDLQTELPGLIQNRLRQVDLPTAERLLAVSALRRPEDQRRLALLRQQMGRDLSRRDALETLKSPSEAELRELGTLHEAAGSFASARKVAAQLGDTVWERQLAERAGDWALAAKLAAQRQSDESLADRAINASLWRLAGHEAAYRDAVQQMIAEGAERRLAWPAAKSLFILGETNAALTIVREHSPQLAFHVLVARQDYHAAFQLVRTPRDAVFDRAWLQLLPQGSNASYSDLTKQFRLASSIAETLYELGEVEAAHRIGDLLLELFHEQLAAVQAIPPTNEPDGERLVPPPDLPAPAGDPFGYHLVDAAPFVDDEPADPFGPRPEPAAGRPGHDNSDLINQLRLVMHLLRATGREEAAWRQAAWLIDRNFMPVEVLEFALGSAPQNLSLSELWVAVSSVPSLSTTGRVRKLAEWLSPDSQDDDWRVLIAANAQELLPLGAVEMLEGERLNLPLSTRTAAELCFLHGEEAWGLKLLVSDPHPHNLWRATKIHLLRGRFDQANDLCQRVLEKSDESATQLFIQGWLQQRLGDVESGKTTCAAALLLASANDSASRELLDTLVTLGLTREAVEISNHLERCASDFELHQHLPACNLLASREPLGAVRHLEAIRRALLGNGGVLVTDDAEYVTFPYTVVRVRARGLLGVGRKEDALREIATLRQICPREIAGLEQFISALATTDQTELAEEWFNTALGAQREILNTWPQAAGHHQRLAWMCARSGRELDAALEHAQTACALQPENALFADTLAEVRYARGELGQAVATAREAVRLAPRDPRFMRRWEEFQALQRGEKVSRSTPEYADRI